MYDPVRVAVLSLHLQSVVHSVPNKPFTPVQCRAPGPSADQLVGVKKHLEDTIYKSLEAHMAPGASGDMSFDNSTNNIIVSRVTYS